METMNFNQSFRQKFYNVGSVQKRFTLKTFLQETDKMAKSENIQVI